MLAASVFKSCELLLVERLNINLKCFWGEMANTLNSLACHPKANKPYQTCLYGPPLCMGVFVCVCVIACDFGPVCAAQIRRGREGELGYRNVGVAVAVGDRLWLLLLHLWGGTSELDGRPSSASGHRPGRHRALPHAQDTATLTHLHTLTHTHTTPSPC